MPQKSKMSPEEKAFLEEVGKKVVDHLNDQPLEVEGSPMAPVKYKDGNFKQKPLVAGLSFFIDYAYVGAKGQLIFGFTPEDAQEYTHAEIPEKRMDEVFPLAGPTLKTEADVSDETEAFSAIVASISVALKWSKDEEEQKALKAYEENSMFGMF